jgi:hypothetical protein
VKVDHKPSGISKHIQQGLQARRRLHIRPHDDQGIIGVLQNLAWLAVDEGMTKQRILPDKLLKHISHQQKEVG